jgi:hypothetical protein
MDQKQLEALFEQAETPDSSPGNIPQPGVPVQAIEVWGADPEDKEGHVKMTDQEIDGILGMHISNSANWYGSEIAREHSQGDGVLPRSGRGRPRTARRPRSLYHCGHHRFRPDRMDDARTDGNVFCIGKHRQL